MGLTFFWLNAITSKMIQLATSKAFVFFLSTPPFAVTLHSLFTFYEAKLWFFPLPYPAPPFCLFQHLSLPCATRATVCAHFDSRRLALSRRWLTTLLNVWICSLCVNTSLTCPQACSGSNLRTAKTFHQWVHIQHFEALESILHHIKMLGYRVFWVKYILVKL